MQPFAAAVPYGPPVRVPPPAPPGNRGKLVGTVRKLIWLYLLLLLLEGALRKWVVPELSNPLLIIRDPVVILIYMFAIAGGVFPRNGFVIALAIIGFLSWASGFLVLLPYLPPQVVFLITGYGFRSDFLHLPLIFIFPAVFDFEDVKRIGWWTILGMIPMGLLMVLQFRASPDSFINRTAGLGEGQQIAAGGGKIRPPGVFSFVLGAIFYLSAAAAFLIHAVLSKLNYKTWILIASGFSLIIAIGCSGSRAAVLSVGLVVASLAVIMLVRPSAVNKFGRTLFLVAIVVWAISHIPTFREGIGVLSDRFTETAEAEDTTIAKDMVSRTLSGFTEPFYALDRLPLWGYGLGLGTNGGARFLVGRAAFLLAENEWSRVMLESGPILGLLFLIWRTVLAFRIGYLSFRQVMLGRTLPIFLFSAGFFALINGSFGQPTSAGFAVVLNGLCLAAMNVRKTEGELAQEIASSNVPRLATRSAFASRIHGDKGDKTNGSVDR
jgi:hypothetical protein